jgi:hypothetical protein
MAKGKNQRRATSPRKRAPGGPTKPSGPTPIGQTPIGPTKPPPRRAAKKQQPSAPPPPAAALDQELLHLARGAAGTVKRVVVGLLVLFIVATIAAALWSLRPVPGFASDDVTSGSPFDVTFKVENDNAWLPINNLRIYCVLAQVRALPIEPTIVEAANLHLGGALSGGLAPGASGSFTCPLRGTLGQADRDDAGVAQRAEIYFRSRYDLPLVGSVRLTENSPLYVLNTRLIPPRWTMKPN